MCVILSCLISTGSLSPVDAQCAFRRYMIDAISSASSNLRRTWDSSFFQAVAIFLRFSRSEQPIGFSFIQLPCAVIMQVIVASFADTRPNVTKSSNVYAEKIERVLTMDLTVGSFFMVCDSMCVFWQSHQLHCQCHIPADGRISPGFRQICNIHLCYVIRSAHFAHLASPLPEMPLGVFHQGR
jgi:hypothetical protein